MRLDRIFFDKMARSDSLTLFRTLVRGILLSALLGAIPAQAAPPNILSRMQWHARSPLREMVRHKPDAIVIHHTAASPNRSKSFTERMQAFQEECQQKEGWADLPYHFIIDSEGEVAEGREIEFLGDSKTRYELSGRIQIALEGNFEEEQPEEAQLAGLRELILLLQTRFHIGDDYVRMHKELAATLCPGRNLVSRLPLGAGR
jgi:hypothetical protein